jgi:hypothetical protein
MFPPAGAGPVKVTLCVAPEISQVTVVPGAVVTVAGLKVSFGVATVGPAAVPGAVTVRVAVTAPAPLDRRGHFCGSNGQGGYQSGGVNRCHRLVCDRKAWSRQIGNGGAARILSTDGELNATAHRY